MPGAGASTSAEEGPGGSWPPGAVEAAQRARLPWLEHESLPAPSEPGATAKGIPWELL